MTQPGHDIPPAELEVLSILWRLGTGTVRQVLDELRRQRRRLAYNTVLTLLARLEQRGYVRCDRTPRAHVYEPLIRRDAVMSDRLGTLVEQLGEGQAAPLILCLVEDHELSPADISQLRSLLADLEADNRKKRKR